MTDFIVVSYLILAGSVFTLGLINEIKDWMGK